ncbi:MAG: type III-B CRISPR module RAMP protein Cmr1 [Ktedonobacteraceae bacterium]
MQEVTFTLQTITPLFLAGANQEAAELRAPSFRGVMRYWLRALVGGLVGADDTGLRQVIEVEADVFGTTDKGSAVSIKMSEPSKQPEQFTERTNIQVRGQWQATGKGYLLWSMARSGNPARGNVKPSRWYFPPQTQFQVFLSARTNTDPEAFKRAVAAFWLLTTLGGLGSRSRRCAGSLTIQEANGNLPVIPGLSFSIPETPQALKQYIEQGIKAARSLYPGARRHISEPFFDIVTPDSCRIWILPDANHTWRNPDEAMRIMGEELQNYRSTIPIQQRKIFGLPLKGFNGRRSSPLLLRVTKLPQEKYVGVVVLFKTRIAGIPMSDYAFIEKWIASSFPNALGVQL